MREAFAGQLAELEQRIDGQLKLAIATLETVAEAVTNPGGRRPAEIADTGRQLTQHSHRADAELVTIVACQTPVASDLRLVLALLQLAHHEGLIANQFELISEQLTEIDADVPDRQRTADKLSSMATLAGSQLQLATTAFASRDLALAEQVDREDDAVDKLNRGNLRSDASRWTPFPTTASWRCATS